VKGVHEWFNQRPEDAATLARRIDELRQGCKTLIEAEHTPLAPADRAWLVERCQTWLRKFDEASSALEAGRDPLAVRAEVDQTVTRIEEVLHDRATQLAAG
jgi:hypothetical protein